MTFKPTEQQQLIIEAVASGEPVVAVEALAGTGKSTTLRLIAEAMPEKSFLYVVFNKSQELEAKKKMPKNVQSRTGNSLAWEYVASVYKKNNLRLDKRFSPGEGSYLISNKEIAEHFKISSYEVTKTVMSKKGPFEINETLYPARAVSHLFRAITKFCTTSDPQITNQHFDPEYSYPEYAVSDARRMWNDIRDLNGKLKLNHDHIVKLWASKPKDLSVSYKDSTKRFDVLMIDEAQDTNPIFGGIYSAQTNMQRVYVGDQNQAIYGFRGAEDELKKIDAGIRLSLTESWRFGQNIAGPANMFLKKLECPQVVSGLSEDPGLLMPAGSMHLPDVVLCRTNVGALRAIFERLEAGYSVRVDKKYKEGLLSLLESLAWFSGFLTDKPKIHADLEKYTSMKEIQQAIDDYEESQKIQEMVHLFKERGYPNLKVALSGLSGHHTKDSIEVITAHRSKGSEWDRVQIYSDFWGYREDPDTEQMIPPSNDEFMLAYVSVTRAKKELDLGSLAYILNPNHDKPRSQRRIALAVNGHSFT